MFNRFLIEGPRGAVLHTGDLRAESWFLTSLTRNPFLQPYITDGEEDLCVVIARGDRQGSLTKTLNAIYFGYCVPAEGIYGPHKGDDSQRYRDICPRMLMVDDRATRSKAW